jgi:hypothetical protein
LEEHVDQLRSQQRRSITEYLFILLAYILRGLGFILVVVSAVFTYMKLTKKTQQKGTKSGSFTNEIEEKLKQKRESIQQLSKRFEEQAHSRFIPVAKTYAEKKKIYEANQKVHKKSVSALSNASTITNTSLLDNEINHQSTMNGVDQSKLKDSKQEEQNIISTDDIPDSDSESEDGFYDIIEQTKTSPSHDDHDDYYKAFEQNMINEAQQIQRMSTLLHESPRRSSILKDQKLPSTSELQSSISPKLEKHESNSSIIKYEHEEDWLDENEFGSYELLQKRSRLSDAK